MLPNNEYLDRIVDKYGENSPEHARVERLMAEQVWEQRSQKIAPQIQFPYIWEKKGTSYTIRSIDHAIEIADSPNFEPCRYILIHMTVPHDFADSLDATAITHQWHYVRGVARKLLR